MRNSILAAILGVAALGAADLSSPAMAASVFQWCPVTAGLGRDRRAELRFFILRPMRGRGRWRMHAESTLYRTARRPMARGVTRSQCVSRAAAASFCHKRLKRLNHRRTTCASCLVTLRRLHCHSAASFAPTAKSGSRGHLSMVRALWRWTIRRRRRHELRLPHRAQCMATISGMGGFCDGNPWWQGPVPQVARAPAGQAASRHNEVSLTRARPPDRRGE